MTKRSELGYGSNPITSTQVKRLKDRTRDLEAEKKEQLSKTSKVDARRIKAIRARIDAKIKAAEEERRSHRYAEKSVAPKEFKAIGMNSSFPKTRRPSVGDTSVAVSSPYESADVSVSLVEDGLVGSPGVGSGYDMRPADSAQELAPGQSFGNYKLKKKVPPSPYSRSTIKRFSAVQSEFTDYGAAQATPAVTTMPDDGENPPNYKIFKPLKSPYSRKTRKQMASLGEAGFSTSGNFAGSPEQSSYDTGAFAAEFTATPPKKVKAKSRSKRMAPYGTQTYDPVGQPEPNLMGFESTTLSGRSLTESDQDETSSQDVPDQEKETPVILINPAHMYNSFEDAADEAQRISENSGNPQVRVYILGYKWYSISNRKRWVVIRGDALMSQVPDWEDYGYTIFGWYSGNDGLVKRTAGKSYKRVADLLSQ